jgi:hypothetical protein
MNRQWAFITGICLILIPIFWLGYEMNPAPGHTSGNGNPAILLAGAAVILFGCLVYVLSKRLHCLAVPPAVFPIGIAAVVVHLILAGVYQWNSFQNYKQLLAETYKADFGFTDWEYIESITSFMSIHINNQLFNVNTYIMFISASLFLALVTGYLHRKIS